uniref:CFA20_dom domain-containing protein n=1 Tax=Haemonchus contortus TaxID=6289 RepID=A0A7I4Z6Z9_HAECO
MRTRVRPFMCTVLIQLNERQNQIQCNLHDFTKRAHGINYVDTVRIQVNANCRLR